MKLTDKCVAAFARHVVADFPREAVGVVVNNRYKRLKNTAADPLNYFEFDQSVLVDHQVQAILHSHPQPLGVIEKWPRNWPSAPDVQAYINTQIPMGIVSSDGENISPFVWLNDSERAPLIGRPFVSGVWDCYSAVRDWYLEKVGIELKNYPRGMDWWEQGQDLYSENFRDAGFEEVDGHTHAMEVGDVLLIQVGKSTVIHHAAVYTGNNEIFHHSFSRDHEWLSGHDEFDRWHKWVKKVIRYQGKGNATAS